LGWGQAFPRGSDKLRAYLGDAVFPYCVLNQTIIIWVDAVITGLDLALGVETAILLTAAFAGCALTHHVIVRHMGRFAVLLGGRPGRRDAV
jgi:hypothetical protein